MQAASSMEYCNEQWLGKNRSVLPQYPELIFGVQPYMRSLGLSQSLTALVWVASPLAGSLVQPWIGVLSDQSRNPCGKRRPFIAGGAVATTVCLLMLAWTKETVCFFATRIGGDIHGATIQTITILLAIMWVYALNIAIQPVQSGIRAFIIDNCPAHQQIEASAWASRITGIGSVLGYLSGLVNVFECVSMWENTQFKSLCITAALALGITVTISCILVQEVDPTIEDPTKRSQYNMRALFQTLRQSLFTLPPVTRKVCKTQFFAWMGWFPFLFYHTTYVGSFYTKTVFHRHRPLGHVTNAVENAINAHGIRVGTVASIAFALVALISNLVLPVLVQISNKDKFVSEKISVKSFSTSFAIPGLTLGRTWTLAHILFATCMFGTFFISSSTSATVIVGIVGISWAVTIWAPFALISEEVAARQLNRRHQAILETIEDSSDQAGAIMGLHNMAIAAPQIIAALICSILFRLLQAAGVEDTIGWALRLGGIAALFAARLASRIGEGE